MASSALQLQEQRSDEEVDEEVVRRLMALGLSRELSIKALLATNNTGELAAVRYAMEHFVSVISQVCGNLHASRRGSLIRRAVMIHIMRSVMYRACILLLSWSFNNVFEGPEFFILGL
jgi:hypothetical protein